MSETTKPTFRNHAEEIAWHLDQRDAQADGVKDLRLVDHAGEGESDTPTAHRCWACGIQYTLKAGEPNVGRCTPCYVEDKL